MAVEEEEDEEGQVVICLLLSDAVVCRRSSRLWQIHQSGMERRSSPTPGAASTFWSSAAKLSFEMSLKTLVPLVGLGKSLKNNLF